MEASCSTLTQTKTRRLGAYWKISRLTNLFRLALRFRDPAVTRILLMPPNCAAALIVFRTSELVGQHRLWVNALCINEACNDEKGAQVAMMAIIYNAAKHVLIWLGSEWAPKTYQDVAPLDKRWLRKVCEFHNGL
ncbi:Heterokaryon incompatibility protein 6, OR allele [Colletotrichum shisoi]|uniref:Heterokaryon incompatibility protein 6, OR allele n=1 Tax=Colletotrichum shisoi TaxID=2078593 RepID=A0A5Q4BBL6_9PEZI|nr:Heterokaryon incompatibility protein 6, OR allele [Colletotrichum shisoi]